MNLGTMRKPAAIFAAVALLLGLLAAVGFTAAGETVYEPLFDFEGEGTLASNNQAQMLASTETQAPLGGVRSLKLTFSDGVVDPIAYNDTAPGASAQGYTGFVLRMKTTSAQQGLFRISSGGLFFSKQIVFLDTQGNDVTDSCQEVPAQDFVSVPENFDGYIFVPFAGEYSGAAFDPAAAPTFPLLVWFYGAGWNNAEVWVDNIGYYKGTGYDEVVAAMPAPERLYQAITSFEDGQFFGGNAMGNTPLSLEESKPLSGERSLKITTKDEPGQNRLYADGVKGAAGFDGFVLRMQTQAAPGAALAFVPRHGAEVWPALGDGVVFLDADGRDVTPEDSSLGDAVKIPENFNGYVFVPFAGDRTDPAFTSDMDFNLLVHMFACSSWGDEVLFDDFGFYRGEPQKVIGQMPLPNDNVDYPDATGELSHMLMDFEGSESVPFGYDTAMGVEVSIDTSGALNGQGNNSLCLQIDERTTDLAFPLAANLPDPKPVGFDGLMLRVKTDAAAPFMLEVYALQKETEIMMSGSALLLNANGRRMTTENTATGVTLPAGFDGYVVVPFAPQFLAKSAYTLYLKWNGPAAVGGSVVHVDSLVYYKGVQYQEIIEEFAPGSIDYTPEEGDPTIPTGTVSHLLFDFEQAEYIPIDPADPESKEKIQQGDNEIVAGVEMHLSLEQEEPLHGEQSMKIEVGELSSAQPWTYVDLGLPTEKPDGFDGIMLGIRTNAFENAILGLWLRPEDGTEQYPTSFGGCLYTRGGRLVTGMDPAIDTGWHGFYLPDQFNGFAFFPFPEDFMADQPYHIILALVGTSNFTDSTTLIDSIGYYKGDDYLAVIEEVAPGSMEGGDEVTIDGDPQYNETYDIRLNPFIEGVLPTSAVLEAERVELTDAHFTALQQVNPDARLYSLLNLYLMDTRGQNVELNVPVELTFGIPYGLNPFTTRILQLQEDGSFLEMDVFLNDMTSMSFYATELGTFALADGFAPLEGELTDLWNQIHTKGEQDVNEGPGEQPEEQPGEQPGEETDVPATGGRTAAAVLLPCAAVAAGLVYGTGRRRRPTR